MFANFLLKSKFPCWENQGHGGKMIHDKTAKIQTSRDTVRLRLEVQIRQPMLLPDFGRLTADGKNPSGKDFMMLARLGEEFK